jgi:hypothetical protein
MLQRGFPYPNQQREDEMLAILMADGAGPEWVSLFLAALGGWVLRAVGDRISQKRVFDHRLRLEKEYTLYTEVWDAVFELRRSVGQLVSPLGTTADVSHSDDVLDAFNICQERVRRGEPFMSSKVYDPAREIVKLAREIVDNERRQRNSPENPAKGRRETTKEKSIAKGLTLDEESKEAFERIESLFDEVKVAIRKRISP